VYSSIYHQTKINQLTHFPVSPPSPKEGKNPGGLKEVNGMKRRIFLLITFSFFILSHPTFAHTWIQVNTSGFGDIKNEKSLSMAVYDNSLYVGTSNTVTGAEIWKYDGTNWTQVNIDGFGDVKNARILSLIIFNDNLYAGTSNSTTGTEVWRYDGQNWTQVNTDGFGDANNYGSYSMAVYYNSLHVGTLNTPTGTEIWKYDGANWTQVNTNGFGEVSPFYNLNYRSDSMAVYKNSLFVGTKGDLGTNVWKTQALGGPPYQDWSRVNLVPGFGDGLNKSSSSMAVYDDNLYVGTDSINYLTGTELWKYGGTIWTQINTDGFGDANNQTSSSMAVFNDNLYVGTYIYRTGTEIWKYDGTNWTQVNIDGFGDVTTKDSGSMAVFNNFLYVGTYNYTTGTKIWKNSTATAHIFLPLILSQ
jgi:hypothetical protein